MLNKTLINLQASSILNVPLQQYDKDFTFIVNGSEYKTSRIISNLLSPKICQYQTVDPTITSFTINTINNGDFNTILDLINFEPKEINSKEISFISEIIDQLSTESINVEDNSINCEITNDNIIELILKHEQNQYFYQKQLENEINFISSHFYEISEENEGKFKEMSLDTLIKIFRSDHLRIKSEDQLISIINKLYSKSSEYSFLYEFICFSNVSVEKMNEFLDIFDIKDVTQDTWKMLSKRLQQKIQSTEKDKYKSIEILIESHQEFDGIVNYIRKNEKNGMNGLIDITSSSVIRDSYNYLPKNAILYDNKNENFRSDNEKNSWICLDFRENRVIPKNYSLRSINFPPRSGHQPKNWVIEGSNNKNDWDILDDEIDCPFINGFNMSHTFTINNPTNSEYRYLRMRLTGPNWFSNESYYLMIDSIEFYGILLSKEL